jgi:hypothetical protein
MPAGENFFQPAAAKVGAPPRSKWLGSHLFDHPSAPRLLKPTPIGITTSWTCLTAKYGVSIVSGGAGALQGYQAAGSLAILRIVAFGSD